MDEILEIVFEGAAKRIDAALTKELAGKGITRSRVQKLIAEGRVILEGRVPKASEEIRKGDKVVISMPNRPDPEPLPLDFPLKVAYEDEQLFVVEKPSGMVTHPAHGHFDDTLVNVLLSLGKPLSEFQGKERAGIVHRLDKETSGLMIIAKTEEAHSYLSGQFADRKVSKEYRALVWGTLPRDEVTVAGSIGRDPKNRQKFAVRTDGKTAETVFTELERMKHISLVLARPKTGRTHQIRVHLAHIHHPIVGDRLYGGRQEKGVPEARLRDAVKNAGRFFLHASRLLFTTVGGERIEVVSEIPRDFTDLMEVFRENE
ncbi:MAG TPA: RluA family pseudouridine synthase [Acidobacteriota bacterium]|nr:RluA family pseudouridine synthase [Acidobacteriota bacterium]HQO19101.1 RluA family pseudouridine synthase [Acidobacteriota bacterium]HQQ46583.1 RluA family pseudouridine synthase [Acidobacteriota bacterium]